MATKAKKRGMATSTSQPHFRKTAVKAYGREIDDLGEKIADRAWKDALAHHWDPDEGALYSRFDWDDVQQMAEEFAWGLAEQHAAGFLGAATQKPSLWRMGLVVSASPALTEGDLKTGVFPLPSKSGRYKDARLLMVDVLARAMQQDLAEAAGERIEDRRTAVEDEY